MTEQEYNRICWHSRRGMLELDLILGPFVQKHFKQISEQNQQRYIQLLTGEDQDLFRYFLEAEIPVEPELAAIVSLILELHHSNS